MYVAGEEAAAAAAVSDDDKADENAAAGGGGPGSRLCWEVAARETVWFGMLGL